MLPGTVQARALASHAMHFSHGLTVWFIQMRCAFGHFTLGGRMAGLSISPFGRWNSLALAALVQGKGLTVVRQIIAWGGRVPERQALDPLSARKTEDSRHQSRGQTYVCQRPTCSADSGKGGRHLRQATVRLLRCRTCSACRTLHLISYSPIWGPIWGMVAFEEFAGATPVFLKQAGFSHNPSPFCSVSGCKGWQCCRPAELRSVTGAPSVGFELACCLLVVLDHSFQERLQHKKAFRGGFCAFPVWWLFPHALKQRLRQVPVPGRGLTAPRETALLPCNHFCVCYAGAPKG